jgi:predicted nucleic acid-binding protein
MKIIAQEPVFSRYIVDTNIVIYTLKGVEKIVQIMESWFTHLESISNLIKLSLYSDSSDIVWSA